MTISRLSARAALMLLPALALGGCGSSSREEELEKQLADTKSQLQAEIAARKLAEQRADAVTQGQARSSALDSFYAESAAPDGHDGNETQGGGPDLSPPEGASEPDGGPAG